MAGPISSGVFEGVARGVEWGRKMFLDGLAPFIPHFDAFFFLPDGYWKGYLEYDLEYVEVSDAIFRLKGESKGADLECEVARELKIPVFYEDEYLDLLAYAQMRGLAGVRVERAAS